MSGVEKKQQQLKQKKTFNAINEDSGGFQDLYSGKDLITTTKFLKNTESSVIFGQHAIEEGYVIKEDERTLLFFHFKFAEKLGIQNEMDSEIRS